jgi:hypothetical protein
MDLKGEKAPPQNSFSFITGIFIALLLGAVFGYILHNPGPRIQLSDKAYALNQDMRKVWEDHVTWTRLAIISMVDDSDGVNQTINRLLQNYEDMGLIFSVYYSEAEVKEMKELLGDHLKIAAEFVLAAKAGEGEKAADAEQRWFSNADDIAAFLSRINPHWDEQEQKSMMYDHLKLTKEEAVARLQKDYDADIIAYEKIHLQALEMADHWSYGIIQQFPDRF